MQTVLGAVIDWRWRILLRPTLFVLVLVSLLLTASAFAAAAPMIVPPDPASPDQPDCTTPRAAISCQRVTLNNVDTSEPQNALEVYLQQGNLTWEIQVANPEDTVPLNNVTVKAYHDGVHDEGIIIQCRDERLSEGESTICDGVGPIRTADDLFAYQFVASGEPENDLGNPITHGPEICRSHYRVVPCEVQIEQYTNDVDADEPCGVELAFDAEVTWRFVVSNRGEANLRNLFVTDNRLGAICNEALLAPGRSFECTALGRAKAGQFSNVSRVVANCGEDLSVEVSDTDPCNYFTCPFDIEKGTNGFDADLPADAPEIPVGDMVTWSYAVNNTSGFTLRNVIVSDDKEGEICRFASMSPGEMEVCTLDSFALDQYSGGVPYANLATLTGENDRCNVICSDRDASHYASTQAPDASIIKSGLPWYYLVTNSGEMTLANVMMEPDSGLSGPFFPCDDSTIRGPQLPVDEVWCYRAAEAPTRGGYGREQRVAAEGEPGAIPVSDSVPLLPYEDLSLIVFVDGDEVVPGVPLDLPVGGSTTWRYVAANNGTTLLSDVEFYHTAMSGVPTLAPRCSFAELPAGTIKECTVSEALTADAVATVGSVQAAGVVGRQPEAFAQEVVVEFAQPGRILGRVFHDLRPANNVRDPLEKGVGGLRVELLDAANATVAETLTAVDGTYAFEAMPGMYSVRFTAENGMWCLPHDHANPCIDSDVDPQTGQTDTFVLEARTSLACMDAGLGTPYSYLPLVER